mgnify:FL=1
MLPYSGQIGYNGIRSEFSNPGNFTLQNAYNGNYGALNIYSYIQPPNTGGANYSPTDWYGYDGTYITTSGLVANYDAWPTVGSYPGNGTVVTNTAGGYNLNLINGVGWSGAIGGGNFIFNGINQYIGLSNWYTPTTTFSAELWFKVDPVGYASGGGIGQSIYNSDDWISSNMWFLFPTSTSPNASWAFYVNEQPAGSFRIRSVSTGGLNSNQWYQIVGTYGANGMKLYLNNTLLQTNTGISFTGPLNIPGNTLVWAGDPRYDFRRFTGNMPIFNFYNKELSATEVTRNWDAYRGRFNL